MRRHLTAEHSGHPDISVRLTRIRLRTRRGEIPQEDHPQARDHDLQIDAQGQRSTIASTPTARKRNLRRTRRRHQRPHQRSFLAASLHCPRNFLVQLLRHRQKQIFRGNPAASKVSYSDSECIRVQGASARFEQSRTQKQTGLKPATRVHRQAATAAGR